MEAPATNERAVENLAGFARLVGFVRYFHPTDEAAAVDWDRFAALGAETVRDLPDDDALRHALRELFQPLAPTLQVFSAAERSNTQTQPERASSKNRLTFWQHQGIQLSDEARIYRSRRVLSGEKSGELAQLFPAPAPQPFEKNINPDVLVRLPLALPRAAGAKKESPAFAALQARLAALDLANLTPADWRLRVGGVITAWNVFQHFHPCLDGLGVDWEGVLRPTLRRALADETGDDYHATLSEMVAQLQDGHGYVYGPPTPMGGLPIRVSVIDEQIVVTGVAGGVALRKGDTLVRIDGAPALEVLHELERYISGSPHLRRHRALNQFGEGAVDSVARIEIVRDGETLPIEVVRDARSRGFFFKAISEFEFPELAEVRPGVFYVNLFSCSVATLEENLPELARARGVIFDQRWDGRPPASSDRKDRIQPHGHIIPHLIDREIKASPMLTPQITLPDRAGWTYRESTWPVKPEAPRLTGRIVFINEPGVVSYGETCMAMIAHYRLATLVGAPTAGCNGNANFIHLPGGYRIMWTGMDVLKHDRSSFYGVGFAPDHPVTRTLAAAREGRDEYLETAIAVIDGTTSEGEAPSEPQ